MNFTIDESSKQQRLQLASDLAGNVQHSFNNIINAAFGYANLLSRRPDEDIAEHLLGTLERASVLMRNYTYLVRDSRQEETDVNLREVICDVQSLFEIFPSGRLVFNDTTSKPVVLRINKHVFYHALTALCMQSRSILDADVVVTLSVQSESEILIAIGSSTCDGSQIACSSQTTAVTEVPSALIDRLGGELYSLEDRFFNIRLPTTRPRQVPTVLLIDADAESIKSHKKLISSNGYSVIETTDSSIALDIFEHQPEIFSAVAIEGDIDNSALLMRIKALHPQVRTVIYGDYPVTGRLADAMVEKPATALAWNNIFQDVLN